MKRELLMGVGVADEAPIGWTIVDVPTETTRVRVEENSAERFHRTLATWIVILTAGVLLGANLQSVAGVPPIAADVPSVVDQSMSAQRSLELPAAPPADLSAAPASWASPPPCLPFDYRPVECPPSPAANASRQPSGPGVSPD